MMKYEIIYIKNKINIWDIDVYPSPCHSAACDSEDG